MDTSAKKPRLAVIGSGGFGREVLDIARDQGRELAGVFDDFPTDENKRLIAVQGVSLLGDTDAMIEFYDPSDIEYVIGIGDGAARKRLDEKLSGAGFEAATLVHSSSSMGYGVALAGGVVVCAGARLTTNISVGRHVHINLNATVGHDTSLESFVTVNPGAAISGNVSIGEGTLVGGHAFVLQKLTIGAFSVVGASASVIKPVGDGVTVVGVPARVLER